MLVESSERSVVALQHKGLGTNFKFSVCDQWRSFWKPHLYSL